MDKQLAVSIPESIRAILAAWGAGFDPAAYAVHAGCEASALSALFRQVAARGGQRILPRRALAQLYICADLNRQFGMVAELRREGDALFGWIEPIVAQDTVLREHLGAAGGTRR